MTYPVRDIIVALKKNGVSFREMARHLGVTHRTVGLWAKGIYKPRDPDKILRKLSGLLVEDRRPLVDDYYSSTHNGEPNHLFGLKPGEDHHVQKIKRMIKKIADILDTYNRTWIETATQIGLIYIKNGGSTRLSLSDVDDLALPNIKLYGKTLSSFTLACYRVAMLKIHYVYPEWNEKIRFMTDVNLIDPDTYLEFFTRLSREYLA